MNKENMIELLEDFIDFLKEKEGEKEKENEVEIIVEDVDTTDDDDFDKTIDKIAKGE